MKLGQLAEEGGEAEALNITPLIDIVFILLIFFVVTSTFSRDLGLDVERPEASTASEQPTQVVRVAVGSRGEIAVDGHATSPWRVEAEVRDHLIDMPERSVLLVADRGVEAQALVDLMDACRRAGAAHVALAVEPAVAGALQEATR